MNEKELIKACQKGEKQAFEELIRLFYPFVSKFLLKITCDKLLSEDLTQETFLKMIRSIEKYSLDGSASFSTWLITIAKNSYIDHLRRSNIKMVDIAEVQFNDWMDVTDCVIQKMRYEEVIKEIGDLPPEQGLAIRLKYEENMTLAEIAKQFGVAPKTIKSRIHDGTVKLRRLLDTKRKE